MANALPVLEPGSVWLVGAGPGDPGLLSWLAVHALRSADAVLHDRGIAESVLDLAGTASIEAVESGPAALDRAIALARDGWRVVRLVEGDPLSRREGVAAAGVLAKADIGFGIVPGITTGTALNYPGDPAAPHPASGVLSFAGLAG
jgi:uroporphyrin-III C-methyltransferase